MQGQCSELLLSFLNMFVMMAKLAGMNKDPRGRQWNGENGRFDV